MLMSDFQTDALTADCVSKASELDQLKAELEKCDKERRDVTEHLAMLSADKNTADADLVTSRSETAELKKELEVYIFIFLLCNSDAVKTNYLLSLVLITILF